PDVRPRRLLRFEPTPTRERTFSHDRPSGDGLGRARGGLAVVLHRRPTGLTIWQAGRAMSDKTDGDTTTAPEPVAEDSPTAPPDGSTVMLLGSGELSRELALAFQRLGADVIAVDRYADAPAHGVADRAAVVKMNDAEELTATIERANPRVVVAESGVIAVDALVAAAERGLEVF